jgi:NAD(P)-dependent dehydrogenase (short-subunit alcohol dehydrogenase family)
VDINETLLAKTVEKINALGKKGLGICCDLRESADIRRLFQTIDRTFGRVDILVNNAFTSHRSTPEDLSLSDWNRVMNVNSTAYFLCAQAAGQRMIKQGNGGSIINISSIAGASALGRGNFVYSVSKGAVNQLTRELAVEWAKHRIRVNAILPCQTETPAVQTWLSGPAIDATAVVKRVLSGIPMNRFAQPGDFVGPAVFLASRAAAMVTGTLLPVDGGNLALNAGGEHG